MIADDPKPFEKMKTEAEQEAWTDGWRAAGNDVKRHVRPNYLTHLEREAFYAGWDTRAYYTSRPTH